MKEGGHCIVSSLTKLFNLSLTLGKFPLLWKQANVIPLHKKDDKSDVNNYRPISLLSTAGKVFERIIFKYVYNFLQNNFILSVHQSGFLPGRSTITQLLEVYHKFCQALESHKEIRVVFLDISKAFDKVWHKGLLFKLKKCGISGRLLLWFEDYLKDHQQRVVISGQASEWGTIKAGVPQGSVLGPLLFLLYINDLPNVVRNCEIRLFADDTCLFIEVDNRLDTSIRICEDLASINEWSKKWIVKFSAPKTKSLIISNKKDSQLNPRVYIDNQPVDEVKTFKYLGLHFMSNLRWSQHIESVSSKAQKRLNSMLALKWKLDRKSLEIMYSAFILPSLEYGNVVWGGTFDSDLCKLERIHVEGMRLITGATARSSISRLYEDTGFFNIKTRCNNSMLTMMFKIKNNNCPAYLRDLLPPENKDLSKYNLRNKDNFNIPFARLDTFKRSFFPAAVSLWNALSENVRILRSLDEFKNYLKSSCDELNVLYYYGQRWPSVHHARLRMGCSKLRCDLFFNLHVIDDPKCACGALIEDAHHFFVQCPTYDGIRIQLRNAFPEGADFTINNILYGNPTLSHIENVVIFGAVHTFIVESDRFL